MKTWCPPACSQKGQVRESCWGPGNWFLVFRKMSFCRMRTGTVLTWPSPLPSCLVWGSGDREWLSHLGWGTIKRYFSLFPTWNPWLCGSLRAGSCLAAANHRPGGLSPWILIASLFSLPQPPPDTSSTKQGLSCLCPSWPSENLKMELRCSKNR